MMRKTCVLIVVLALALASAASASTSADKQAAIDKGLAWLASKQQPDGSWIQPSYNNYIGSQAAAGAALLAFTDQFYKPLGWNGADYSGVVTKATNYLLSMANPVTMNPNWWSFPASTQTGLLWGGTPSSGYSESTYTTGIVTAGLSRLVSNPYGGAPLVNPTAVIPSGAAAGLTYTQAIQKVVNTMAWGQTGPASGVLDGGWRYVPNSGDSDMSTTQWGPIIFLFASNVPGVTIPNDGTNPIQTHLQKFLTADQITSGPNKGGLAYQPTNLGYIVNATHAGGYLLSHLFAGGGGSFSDALTWLDNDWKSPPSGTWFGNEGNPYAMWAVYKGLESNFGTTAAGPITNLNTQTTSLDSGAVWNWWEDYCQFLVLNQVTTGVDAGSWPGYGYWDGPLEAAWYINILNATETGPGPVIPIPGTVGLLGTGILSLLGAGWWRRRKS